MAEIQIAVDPALMGAAEVKSALEGRLAREGTPVAFALREPDIAVRAVVPAILVAAVESVSSVLAAIIGGIAGLAKQQAEQKIIIQSKGGARIEFPADTPPERVDQLIRQARLLDAEHIRIGLA